MILIVDFGSQTAHLIGRRLKMLGVDVVYTSPDEALNEIQKHQPKGVILSGGPAGVNAEGAPTVNPKLFELDIPILGICYGWQLMAKLLGGAVVSENREYGPELVTYSDNIFNLRNLSTVEIMSHGDCVKVLPKGFSQVASTSHVACAAAYHPEKKLYGIQYHPELNVHEAGIDLLRFFVVDIARCKLNPQEINVKALVDQIKAEVGSAEVLCGVSGGVDSTVVAALIHAAIGDKLTCVYVESGLMRDETRERVLRTFKDVIIIQAKDRFYSALQGVSDSELKRKIIGKLYVDIFQEIAQSNPDITFLAQGTIYSDVIESKGTPLSSHIKSHHNVGGLPDTLTLKLLEPLRYFYKDEVRDIGKKLFIDDNTLFEHPFPGPGYAIRIRGEVTEKRLMQVKMADAILIDELKKAGLYDSLFQCFAVMTGASSSAVKGDEGVIAEVVAIRAYTSIDVMTSDWARLPNDVLARISARIVNSVPDVSRVVYDISTKPPSTMEWE